MNGQSIAPVALLPLVFCSAAQPARNTARFRTVPAERPDTRRPVISMEETMFTDFERTYASPSLEATMNHGLFGCANLTPTCDSVCIQRNRARGRKLPEKPAQARAKGFSNYLDGRLQRA